MKNSVSKPEKSELKEPDPLICGIIRPISAAEDCTEAHWAEVHRIIDEALQDTGFRPRLVSSADESGVIQQRIVQNLADDPLVICDVSTRNPNVMFELGMRLAFDMPTIVIKDDKTNYSFDTSPIEHIPYPRDLRYYRISDFKAELSNKVKATHAAAQDADYSTFLKFFKRLKAKKGLSTEEVAIPQIILDQITSLRGELREIIRQRRGVVSDQYIRILFSGTDANLTAFAADLIELPLPNGFEFERPSGGSITVETPDLPESLLSRLFELAKSHSVLRSPVQRIARH